MYEIIGHGSFASVYRGKCKKTGQTVAVKMVSYIYIVFSVDHVIID